MGLSALRKIQIGEESAKGTAVAATEVLFGTLTMKENPTIHRPMDERGNMSDFTRSVKVADMVEMAFEGDATFEQIMWWLHAGVLGDVTPSTVDTDGKQWTFTPSMTAAGTFDSFTLEYGDDVQAWESEYVMARRIEISGAMNEAMRCRVELFGRNMSQTTFTTLSAPTDVETAIAQKTKIYVDDEDGTIGSTELDATLVSWSYVINTGLYPKRYGDGGIDFSAYGEAKKGVELRMTLAFKSGVETERLNFDGETLRLIRIETEGSLCGATSQLKTITLDACGIYTGFESLADRDGEDVVEVNFSTQLGSNYTKLFEVEVINAYTSL